MTMKRLNIKVNEETYNWISEQSNKRGLTMNAVVILAIETYVTQSVVTGNLPELLAAYKKMQENGEI